MNINDIVVNHRHPWIRHPQDHTASSLSTSHHVILDLPPYAELSFTWLTLQGKEEGVGNSGCCKLKVIWFVVIFGINTTSDISKLFYIILGNFEISRVVFMPNITYNSCYYLFILQPEKFSLFIELFHFVGEQIGFVVLVFGPAGPEPGRCSFLSILVFQIFF